MTQQIVLSVQNYTLCIPIQFASTLNQLKDSVLRLAGIDPLFQRFLLNGRDIEEPRYQEAITVPSDFLSLNFVLLGGCAGGKGGFGSLLRSAKSKKKRQQILGVVAI